MFSIDVLILTKSSKHDKYCVAGVDVKTREWVRLVSTNDECDGAVSKFEMTDKNGYEIVPLDVVRVMVNRKCPIGCQTENYELCYGYKWQLIGRMSFNDVMQYIYPSDSKFIFGNSYMYISHERIEEQKNSLLIAEVKDLRIFENERRKQKCDFKYGGYTYNTVSMTDPEYYHYEDCYIEKAYIVVSLPHSDYNGKHYKFVAKIFPVTPVITKIKPLADLFN